MKDNKVILNVGRGFPAEKDFLAFDKQTGKEAAHCWAKPNLHNNGFTLIELLVVVLIIGILAAVAVPQYKIAVYKSKYAKLKANVKTILEAEEVYYLANNTYTTDFDKLDIGKPKGCVLTISSKSTEINCSDSSIKMRYYTTKLQHNGSRRSLCVFEGTDNNSAQAKVCRIETGSKNCTEGCTGNVYRAWKY